MYFVFFMLYSSLMTLTLCMFVLMAFNTPWMYDFCIPLVCRVVYMQAISALRLGRIPASQHMSYTNLQIGAASCTAKYILDEGLLVHSKTNTPDP